MKLLLSANRLDEISEAFITNTSFEIAPVVSIDGKPVGEGAPGPVTKLLREKFDAEITRFKRLNSRSPNFSIFAQIS